MKADDQKSKETLDSSIKTRKLNVGRKTVEIEQKFSATGDPLCTHCGEVVSRLKCRVKGEGKVGVNSNLELSKLPFQGRFCSLDCSQRYFVFDFKLRFLSYLLI